MAYLSGQEVARTVMVRIDGRMVMAVLPVACRINLKRPRRAIGARKVELATEQEFKGMSPECEPGAMHPFDNKIHRLRWPRHVPG